MKTTAEIAVPTRLIDQVIGQDEAVEVIRKAVEQRRFVLIVGEPGTGKSMLGQAMSELLPTEILEDVVIEPNPEDRNLPKVRVVPAGEGERILAEARRRTHRRSRGLDLMVVLSSVVGLLVGIFYAAQRQSLTYVLGSVAFVLVLVILRAVFRGRASKHLPRLLICNAGKTTAPFVDATGLQAGGLLGDVRHDPYQSGGVETPPHALIEPGAIHRAHKGVLYIDEVTTLGPESQQSLLSAIQQKSLPITGRSPLSSGAMVRTDPVPCDFILVLAGNRRDVEGIHPALRSRMRGFGYEVHTHTAMPDTPENRARIAQFVAQEVRKDGRIPHFTAEAVEELVEEARRRSGQADLLTLRLRDLGGLVRAAGDLAVEEKAAAVEARHVREASRHATPIEERFALEEIARQVEMGLFRISGQEVGRVNGFGWVEGRFPVVVPVTARVHASSANGRLPSWRVFVNRGDERAAAEAVQALAACLPEEPRRRLEQSAIFLEFGKGSAGGEEIREGRASAAVALAVYSALENAPLDQATAVLGSLSISGEILPVEMALRQALVARLIGFRRLLVPPASLRDCEVALKRPAAERGAAHLEVLAVATLSEAMEHLRRPVGIQISGTSAAAAPR